MFIFLTWLQDGHCLSRLFRNYNYFCSFIWLFKPTFPTWAPRLNVSRPCMLTTKPQVQNYAFDLLCFFFLCCHIYTLKLLRAHTHTHTHTLWLILWLFLKLWDGEGQLYGGCSHLHTSPLTDLHTPLWIAFNPLVLVEYSPVAIELHTGRQIFMNTHSTFLKERITATQNPWMKNIYINYALHKFKFRNYEFMLKSSCF